MVIDKTMVRVISLSNGSCPYEFNASIDFWLKTTSHVDVIASVGNSHRSAGPRPTTLEEDRGLFVDFSLILCLWFEIQSVRTYNFLTEFQTLVIAPSTVSTTQNAKLLPSPNLGHSLMLCQVTRSQGMGSVKHFDDPPVLVEPSRLRRNRRSCTKWITRDTP